MSPIKGLSEKRRLPRLGKIHLGTRHPEKGYPMKTDYFVCPPEVQKVFGDKPKELKILIPVEDDEKWCSQYYRCYSKTRGLICKGDGEVAIRMVDTQTGAMADRDSKAIAMKEMACQGRECPDYKVKCKEVMNLQFLLPEVPGIGIWQIDTSSINSIRNINSTAELLKGIYGHICMLPLLLTLEPIEVNNPDDGKKQTVYTLNIRTNANLLEMSQQAGQYKKLVAGISMPVSDDERPDLTSPEFEPDPVELPPDNRPIEQVIEDIWGPSTKERETPPPKPKTPPKAPKSKSEPVKEQSNTEPPIIDTDWLKEELSKIQSKGIKGWSNKELVSYLKVITGKEAASVSEAVSYLNKERADEFVTKIQETISML